MQALAAIALVMAAATAVTAGEKSQVPWYPRVSVGAGIGYWIGDVGALSPTGGTLQLQGDVEITRMLHLRVLYEHAFLTARDEILTAPRDLALDGLALLVHHPIFGFTPAEIRIGGDMHVIAGVEREWMRWESGPRFRRYEAVAGFGGSIVVYDKQTRTKPMHQIDYGLRMLFSRAPDPGKLPAGCDGPCDMATTAPPFDTTIIMEVAWRYGR